MYIYIHIYIGHMIIQGPCVLEEQREHAHGHGKPDRKFQDIPL